MSMITPWKTNQLKMYRAPLSNREQYGTFTYFHPKKIYEKTPKLLTFCSSVGGPEPWGTSWFYKHHCKIIIQQNFPCHLCFDFWFVWFGTHQHDLRICLVVIHLLCSFWVLISFLPGLCVLQDGPNSWTPYRLTTCFKLHCLVYLRLVHIHHFQRTGHQCNGKHKQLKVVRKLPC